MLGKALGLIAALAPTAAGAHCCCEREHHHHRKVTRSYHRVERMERWDTARFQVTAGRPCRYPAAIRGASGVTVVKMHVDEDGFVDSVRLGEGSGSRVLDRAALACVSGWHLQAGYEWRVARVVWTWHWSSYYG